MILTGGRKFDITLEEKHLLEELNITRQAYINRITQCKWSKRKALTKKPVKRYMLSKDEKALLKKNGIKVSTFSKRVARGWSIEKALNERPNKYKKTKGVF